MLADHYKYTGSRVADVISKDFDDHLKYFVKVFPKDYKKALAIKLDQAKELSKQ